MQRQNLARRQFLRLLGVGATATTLVGCNTSLDEKARIDYGKINRPSSRLPQVEKPQQGKANAPHASAELYPYARIYASVNDGDFTLPAIPYQQVPPQFLRQIVDDPTGEIPGTVVVDTSRRFLYLVRKNGKAIRYGVGIGRDGFSWSGRALIHYKKPWPRWYPPPEMIARRPELEPYSGANGGMAPGLKNPLGARALYIFKDGRDTLYRLHGNPEWWSIGKAVSSGCVRLMNQDIIDLYERVPDKTPILVI